ncbi:MAG: hypothetical protein K2H21_04545 [Muribaculaceae bacterium]|nr:hypothetical protein [Muribaculaceae bacterium]
MKEFYMKLTPTARKAISALLIMLLMAGVYGAIVALCNQYLREHQMLSTTSQYLFRVIGFVGFFLIYRWFARRIDRIAKR